MSALGVLNESNNGIKSAKVLSGGAGLHSWFNVPGEPGCHCEPSMLLELAGWRGEDHSMGLEAATRVRDDRSAKRGDMPSDYQPRERRERMSPEDRIQLRRDVRDAGRDIYPVERRGRHHGGRGGERN